MSANPVTVVVSLPADMLADLLTAWPDEPLGTTLAALVGAVVDHEPEIAARLSAAQAARRAVQDQEEG